MPSENDYKAFVDDYLNTRDRLTAVENKVEQLMNLLKDISTDLSNGDKDDKLRKKTTIKAKRKSSIRQSN